MPPSLPSQTADAAEVESLQYRFDSQGTQDLRPIDAAESVLPCTPEEIDIITERREVKPWPHTQPSHREAPLTMNRYL